MYNLTAKIEIGQFRFLFANQVQVKSSRKALGDTCTIRLPKFWPQHQKLLEQRLEPGSRVLVQLGYDDQNVTVFEGYVAQVKPTIPLEIICEDELYKLKRKRLADKTFRNALISDVLAYCYDGPHSGSVPVIKLEQFRIEKGATAAQVLGKIRDNYGLDIYFRGRVLYAGLAYQESGLPATVVYHVQRNVVNTDLTFRRPEDVRICLKLESIGPDNKRIKAQVGEPDGEVRTFHRYRVGSEAELKKIGEAALVKMRYEGYRGSFTGFGWPMVTHSQVVQVFDEYYPEQTGKYLVDGVEVEWGMSGFRRKIELGQAVAK